MRSIIAVLVVLGALALIDSWRHRLGACLTGGAGRCHVTVRGAESKGAGGAGRTSLLEPGAPHSGRAWPEENRRTIDGALAGAAAVIAGLAAVVAKSAPEVDEKVAQALIHRLRVSPVLLAHRLRGRSRAHARDLVERPASPGLGAGSRSVVASLVVVGLGPSRSYRRRPNGPRPSHVFSNWGFPELRLACAVAVSRSPGRSSCGRYACSRLARRAGGSRCGRARAGSPSRSWPPSRSVSARERSCVSRLDPRRVCRAIERRARCARRRSVWRCDDLRVSERQRIGAAEYRATTRRGVR